MSFLDEIVANKIEKNKDRPSESLLYSRVTHEERSEIRKPNFDISSLNVIAEIKRRSPSKGHLADIIDPGSLAANYESGGANVISVLTEKDYFGAEEDDLQKVRESVSVPVLRKDFIVDLGDVFESYLMNADLVLLIVAAFKDLGLLKELYTCSVELGLLPLVETHHEREIEVANSMNAELIGVNVRNLETFDEDSSLGEKLMQHINPQSTKVWESSISSLEDAQRAFDSSANVVLVGQALVQHNNPAEFIQQMRNIGK